jgi:hypothetical protein
MRPASTGAEARQPAPLHPRPSAGSIPALSDDDESTENAWQTRSVAAFWGNIWGMIIGRNHFIIFDPKGESRSDLMKAALRLLSD